MRTSGPNQAQRWRPRISLATFVVGLLVVGALLGLNLEEERYLASGNGPPWGFDKLRIGYPLKFWYWSQSRPDINYCFIGPLVLNSIVWIGVLLGACGFCEWSIRGKWGWPPRFCMSGVIAMLGALLLLVFMNLPREDSYFQGSHGFPFTYYRWADELIFPFKGRVPGEELLLGGLLANILFALAVALAVGVGISRVRLKRKQ